MFGLTIKTIFLEIALHERNTGVTTLLLFAVFFGFVLIGLARMSYPNLFGVLLKNFIRTKPIDNSFGEDVRIHRVTSVLLNFNFVFSLGLSLFLLAKNQLEIGMALLVACGGAIVYFIVNQFGFRIVSLVLGESKLVDNLTFISSSLLNFGGVFLALLSLIWALNPELTIFLSWVLMIFLGCFYIIRIFKGLNITIRERISWYYLILYLCTVEVLPMLIVSRTIWLEFH
ncbi:MAG: DUF4271 domain-containing protein [Bacteroidetes bacterium]|nr:DUF4271 domain-containing protein [Bacteroidota bacterium]